MKPDLTVRQKQVLNFIRDRINHDRISPTIREVAGFFGFSSTGTVRDYLQVLSRKGYLKLNKNKARSLELINQEQGLAIVGMVACGKPQFAQEDIEGYLQPEEWFKASDDLFCLKAKGDSMAGAGIMEGDLLVVRRQSQAQNNEIVVALIGDEATVKFLRRHKDGKQGRDPKYFLEAANKKYSDIPVTEATSVIGRVISVIRKYV
ncbi:MAG: transcriptional repressor LexA [Candidatus Omnitrophica bacterium]|nr:transcriptional repressor LexA [Candidatus Omnitrophota bacterium]